MSAAGFFRCRYSSMELGIENKFTEFCCFVVSGIKTIVGIQIPWYYLQLNHAFSNLEPPPNWMELPLSHVDAQNQQIIIQTKIWNRWNCLLSLVLPTFNILHNQTEI